MAKRFHKKRKPPEVGQPQQDKAGKIIPPASVSIGFTLLRALVIVAAGFWIFWPSVHGQWIGDDNWYLPTNPLMRDPARLWKAWFQIGSWVEYYPIEESLQWMQWQLWHNDTFGYHLTNIILHVTSALLVWRLLNKFGLRLAWLGGLLFAVHPMTVDSVALINEFKTSLSLPPFLLAMGFWIDYEENRKSRNYWLALGLFIVAMLCKITMMMFPVVILLYAWWKRGGIGWNDLKASLPFFIVSLVLGLTSIHAGTVYSGPYTSHTGDSHQESFLWRLVLSGETIAFYFSRCFLPTAPIPIYHQWHVDPSSPAQYLPWLILGIVLYHLWTKREGWGRHVLLGLGFFLIMLVPFWGFQRISYMNETWILEHLLYIPIIGLIGLVATGMERINDQLPRSIHPYGIGIVAAIVALLAFESHVYAGMFINEETICRYTLQINPEAYPAYTNLGNILLKKGRVSQAFEQYEQALRLKPGYAGAHLNMGNALCQMGRLSEAVEQYQQALRINPDYVEAHNNLGVALYHMEGRETEAIEQYRQALRINPDDAEAHNGLGVALYHTKGQVPEAIEQYRQALRINPDYANAHNNLGYALYMTGHVPEAIEHFEQAVRIIPDFAEAHYNLGDALYKTGRVSEAIEQYEQTMRINPDFAEVRKKLAQALQKAAPVKN